VANGEAAGGGVAEGDPTGRDVAEGEAADRDAGVGVGFTCTCTSAAKRAVPASRATAKDDQNLSMTAYATQCSPFRKVNLALAQVRVIRQKRSVPPTLGVDRSR